MAVANRWFFMAFAWVGLGACAASPKPVLSVAEYDLSCSRVEVSRIDDDHYAASGCGRGAVYVQSCDDGSGCRWGRMRHGHEVDVAAAQAPLYGTPAPREVISAPPPAQREVLPAPQPGEPQREVLPAPPPATTSGGEAPGAGAPSSSSADPNASIGGSSAALSADPTTAPAQDQLSAPYQAEVPAVPTTQRVQYAPPAPLAENPPPPPSTTYVWVSGYWWSGNWGWTWVPGYWCPPRYGYSWIGGGWYWYSNYWWYYPGGWGYPGTRTIVYAPSPRPQRVVTVRTIRPSAVAHSSHFATNNSAVASHLVTPRAASPSSFRPQGSPLLHYPTPVPQSRLELGAGVHAFHPGQPNQSSVGRLVRPSESVPPRASYGSRSNFGGSGYSHALQPGSRGGSMSHTRSPSSMPSRGPAPSRAGPGSFHMPSHGGGGMPMHGGGGGGMHMVHPHR
jgi:hypothetical protein